MEKNNIEQLCYQQANIDVVIPAAWLHDCVPIAKNSPLRAQSSQLAATQAKIFLTQHQYKPDLLNEIAHAIEAHSYSANIIPRTLEAKIVQDADRLDALGAIGLTRAIMVSNQLDLEFYHTQDPFCKKREPNDHQYGLDHFYTKLLTLAEKFHTHAGKVEAQRRIEFLHQYLNQLSSEI